MNALFYIHAIDNQVAEDLLTGEMENRVEKVFLPVAHAHERARTTLAAESNNLIVKTIVRLFTPFIQIYGLYVIAHGHYSPGGGFQGGRHPGRQHYPSSSRFRSEKDNDQGF